MVQEEEGDEKDQPASREELAKVRTLELAWIEIKQVESLLRDADDGRILDGCQFDAREAGARHTALPVVEGLVDRKGSQSEVVKVQRLHLSQGALGRVFGAHVALWCRTEALGQRW